MDKLDRQELAAKACTRCLVEKPVEQFGPKRTRCTPCRTEMNRLWRERNPDRVRRKPTPEQEAQRQARAYKKRMGITIEERDAMLEAQGGCCAICGATESRGQGWCTDHDHNCCPVKARSCGKCIRGILCYNCNTFIGLAHDSIENLASAIGYLLSWEQRRG